MGFYIIWSGLLQVHLWEVGIGKRDPDDIEEIIAAMDREKAGKTAPAHGLYLEKVFYNMIEATFPGVLNDNCLTYIAQYVI